MLSLIAIVIAALLATWVGWKLWRSISPATITTADAFVLRQLKYQAAFLVVALVVSGLTFAASAQGASKTFGIGALSASVQVEAFGFGHAALASWMHLGILLTLAFGLATYVLCLPSFRDVASWSIFLRKFGGWVVALAALNALSEELIYRGTIVATAEGLLHPWQTALLSAALFSLAHIRGQANGLVVVAGSAIVGWFLAQSVLQTHGLFWAWCMHFVQDMVIFAAFIATAANPSPEEAGSNQQLTAIL